MADVTAYEMVSVPKQSNNQGMPNGKKNVVIIFDFDEVATYTRDMRGINVTALTFKEGYKPIGLFVDESSIDPGDTVEGESYGRGFQHKFNFNHPGDDVEFAEFKANNINASLGAIYLPCKPGSTTAKIYGTPCSPLHITKADEVDSSEANRQEVEMGTAMPTYPVGRIAISAIPATDNADINAYLGLSASAGA